MPERLLTELGHSFDRRAELLQAPGHIDQFGFVYGPDPRLMGYDPMLTMAPPPQVMVQRGQYIPPLPAPQEVCLINGFDPAWGVPPGDVGGVPLQFSADLGGYVFDAAYAQSRGDLAYDRVASNTFDTLWARWNQGTMLQPYKVSGSNAWKFRWIPRVRNVICGSQGSPVQAVAPTSIHPTGTKSAGSMSVSSYGGDGLQYMR